MNVKQKVLIAGVTALVLTAGASAATAAVLSSGPVDSTGVIHGCWTNKALNGSHAFVLQDAGASCPKDTTAISWNMQRTGRTRHGPSGPAGPGRSRQDRAGAAGPAGPAGPSAGPSPTTAGPGGLNVTVVTDGDSYIGPILRFRCGRVPGQRALTCWAGTLAASRLPGL